MKTILLCNRGASRNEKAWKRWIKTHQGQPGCAFSMCPLGFENVEVRLICTMAARYRPSGRCVLWIVADTNSRLKKGKKGPPARGAAPKGLGVFFIRRACLTFPVNASTRQSIALLRHSRPTRRRPPVGVRKSCRLAEPLRRPWRHLPFQGRQSTLDAIWYQKATKSPPEVGAETPASEGEEFTVNT